MKRSAFFILVHLAAIFSCRAQGKVETDSSATMSIVRYATDLRCLDAENAELLVNVLYELNGLPPINRIELELPEAKEKVFRQIFVEVSSNDKKFIFRRKIRKPDADELSALDPCALASKYSNLKRPVTVEWEIRVSLRSPAGSYKWPSIATGNFERIDHFSFRVAYGKELSADIQTNLTTDPQKDTINGNFYYLWEFNDVNPSRTELKGFHSHDPYVILNFR